MNQTSIFSDTQIASKWTAKAGEKIAEAYKGKIKAEKAKELIFNFVFEAVKEARNQAQGSNPRIKPMTQMTFEAAIAEMKTFLPSEKGHRVVISTHRWLSALQPEPLPLPDGEGPWEVTQTIRREARYRKGELGYWDEEGFHRFEPGHWVRCPPPPAPARPEPAGERPVPINEGTDQQRQEVLAAVTGTPGEGDGELPQPDSSRDIEQQIRMHPFSSYTYSGDEPLAEITREFFRHFAELSTAQATITRLEAELAEMTTSRDESIAQIMHLRKERQPLLDELVGLRSQVAELDVLRRLVNSVDVYPVNQLKTISAALAELRKLKETPAGGGEGGG